MFRSVLRDEHGLSFEARESGKLRLSGGNCFAASSSVPRNSDGASELAERDDALCSVGVIW